MFWWYTTSQTHHNEAEFHCPWTHPTRPDIHTCSRRDVGCISGDKNQLLPLPLYICHMVLPGWLSGIKKRTGIVLQISLNILTVVARKSLNMKSETFVIFMDKSVWLPGDTANAKSFICGSSAGWCSKICKISTIGRKNAYVIFNFNW